MSALSELINGAIDDTFKLLPSGTTLENFLTKFSPSDGKWAATLDPLNTFDITIQFHPSKQAELGNPVNQKKQSTTSKKQLADNAANNATAGIADNVKNDEKNTNSVTKAMESFGEIGETSFLKYIAESNLFTNSDNNIGTNTSSASPLEILLGYYVLNVTVPLMKVSDGGKSDTLLGSFPLIGNVVAPDNNTLLMEVLNTKVPLFERLFYPWMREITLPYWSYKSLPYTTATITIDFSKHTDLSYVFYGCKPQLILTILPTQEADGTITRSVTFLFDFMFIKSKLGIKEKLKEKVSSTGKDLFNAASKIFNMY